MNGPPPSPSASSTFPHKTELITVGPLFLFGLSIGLAAAQLNTVVMSDVPRSRAGDASAAKSAVGRVGNSFGAALVGILIVISINDVLIMVLIFISIALALAFTLPNVKSEGGEGAHEGG